MLQPGCRVLHCAAFIISCIVMCYNHAIMHCNVLQLQFYVLHCAAAIIIMHYNDYNVLQAYISCIAINCSHAVMPCNVLQPYGSHVNISTCYRLYNRLQGTGCRVQGAVYSVQGTGCRIQGAGLKVQVQGVVYSTKPHSAMNMPYIPPCASFILTFIESTVTICGEAQAACGWYSYHQDVHKANRQTMKI